jgi:hypothetical protein
MSCHCPTLNSDSFLFNIAISSQYSLFIVMQPKVWHSAQRWAISRFFYGFLQCQCYANTVTWAKATSEHIHKQPTTVNQLASHRKFQVLLCIIHYSQRKCESLLAGSLSHQQCLFGHHTAYGTARYTFNVSSSHGTANTKLEINLNNSDLLRCNCMRLGNQIQTF